ncbi:D-alanyl-D-alanine carboxypeptidase [Streptomyces sp. NPDC005648]|uniref:D-alanyl-D-alanine carboxypeptidase n=1 Tax=Streptomyces sp. NPDC005648 TaxID=3157044 RepID=UPI0033A530FA
MEEASVAGESPDRSKQRESSAEPTSGSAGPVPEARTEERAARDPRLGAAEARGGVDTATRVFSVRDLKTDARPAQEPQERDESPAGPSRPTGAPGTTEGAVQGPQNTDEHPSDGDTPAAATSPTPDGPPGDEDVDAGSTGDEDERPGSAGDEGEGPGSAGDEGEGPGSAGDEGLGSAGGQDEGAGSIGRGDEGPRSAGGGGAEGSGAGDASRGEKGDAEGARESGAAAGAPAEESEGAEDAVQGVEGDGGGAGKDAVSSSGDVSADAVTDGARGEVVGDARLRAAVAAWVRSGDSEGAGNDAEAAGADERGAAEGEGDSGGATASGAEPEDAASKAGRTSSEEAAPKAEGTTEPKDARPEASRRTSEAAVPEEEGTSTDAEGTSAGPDADERSSAEAGAEPEDARPEASRTVSDVAASKAEGTSTDAEAVEPSTAESEDVRPEAAESEDVEPEDVRPQVVAAEADQGSSDVAAPDAEGTSAEPAGDDVADEEPSGDGDAGAGVPADARPSADSGAAADGGGSAPRGTAAADGGGSSPQGAPAADGDSGAGGGAVDQPTTMLKRPQLDQPTTMLKLTDPKSDPERTSRFVALKPLDDPATRTKRPTPADATAPVPQVGPERTTQQPLPPKPPLDLLAELTNTPPPPQTPVRTIIRRVKIWTPLVLLLVVVFAIVQAVRPLPTPTLALTAADSYTFDGSKAELPWPSEGQGRLDINGIGTMGTFGKQTPVPIGSVAKAMTAYIVLKDHPLKPGQEGEKITVDALAEKEGGYDKDNESTLNTVKKGDVLTEKQALSAIMIPSANNIARLLARWDAGSETAFIKKMNDTAKELGMTGTTYTDASGLKETTVSTAEDQVRLGNQLVKIQALMDITKLPSWVDPSGTKWPNFDKLVPYNGAIGIKTGTTTKAGGNLLFAATKEVGGETVTVVGAILGQHTAPIIDTVNAVSKKAMLAAQDALRSAKIVKKGTVVGYVDDGLGGHTPVVVTKDVTAIGWNGFKVKLSFDADDVPHTAKAGAAVGTLTVGDGTSGAVKVPVALQKDLTEPGFTAKLKRLG